MDVTPNQLYIIFCHIPLKITTLEIPLTYKILKVRDKRNKTTSLQKAQITAVTPGGNSYIG
jgi:hypothetical protein